MARTPALSILEILLIILVFAGGISLLLQSMIGNASLLAQSQARLSAQHQAKELLESISNLRESNRLRRVARDCLPTPGRRQNPLPTDQDVCGQRIQNLVDSERVITPIRSGDRREFPVIPSASFPTTGTRGYLQVESVLADGQNLPSDSLRKVSAIVEFSASAHSGSVILQQIFADEN